MIRRGLLFAGFCAALVLCLCTAVVHADGQADAVRGLIFRVLPSAVQNAIRVQRVPSTNGKDYFSFHTAADGALEITGSTGVTIAAGLNWYLKYHANVQISWEASNAASLTLPLPRVDTPVHIETNATYRHYMNVCTFQYSHGFWSWQEWERNLDWAALNGVNLPLATAVGYEFLYLELFKRLGVPDAEKFFSGPAFGAWFVMGNIMADWSPMAHEVPMSWITQRFGLLKEIVARARSFGMMPVLPAFAGHVPPQFKTVFPHANLSLSAQWNKFPAQYGEVPFLEPTDPLFRQIGAQFIDIVNELLGSDHFYAGDLFNEMRPRSSDPAYIASTTAAMIAAMTDSDPKAVWVMQGWMFYNEQDFWNATQVKACLEAAPVDHILVLDLYAENYPVWKLSDSFYGRPFIWNMLLGFGGRPGLIGDASVVATAPIIDSKTASSMAGVGITMEAIGTNYVMYELMLESAWRTEVPTADDLAQWFSDYATRRYGSSDPHASRAWSLLASSVYSHSGPAIITALERHPSLVLREAPPFDINVVVEALNTLLLANTSFTGVEAYMYDLVDVKRQVISDSFMAAHQALIEAFKNGTGSVDDVATASETLLNLIVKMEFVLQVDNHFSMDKWVEDAQAWADGVDQVAYFTYQAVNQLTWWGEAAEISDYAAKHWSGLVGKYYLVRWHTYTTCLQEVLQHKAESDAECSKRVLDFESAFQTQAWKPQPAPELTWAQKLQRIASA